MKSPWIKAGRCPNRPAQAAEKQQPTAQAAAPTTHEKMTTGAPSLSSEDLQVLHLNFHISPTSPVRGPKGSAFGRIFQRGNFLLDFFVRQKRLR